MEKLEMRALARAAARAAGLFELAEPSRAEVRSERFRSGPARRPRPVAVPPLRVDEAQARAACAPMGELETIVNSTDAHGRVRSLYVIVPDMTLKGHYERLGFTLEPGCRVLLDAAALLPIALLRIAQQGPCVPAPSESASGFNPYFDLRPE